MTGGEEGESKQMSTYGVSELPKYPTKEYSY